MPDDDDEEHELEPGAEPSEGAVRAALRAIRTDDGPSLRQVLLLVRVSLDKNVPLAPRAVIDACVAKSETDADFANGGADQFAWNHGTRVTREVAASFRAIGAIENADLLDRLATALEAHRAHGAGEAVVRDFLAYRRAVVGPFFGIPEPGEELSEPLVEYAIEHAGEWPDPEGPLPGF